MSALRGLRLTAASLALGALALAAPASAAPGDHTAVMPVIHVMGILNGANGDGNGNGASKHGGGSSTSNMYYHGGTSDGSAGTIGVETTPKVYLVFWGSQWTGNDPSGEASILEKFFGAVGGSHWNNTVTQYCQGIASGSSNCTGAFSFAGNQLGVYVNSWYDNGAAAPSHPSQSQLAAEAVNAANHFGNTGVGSNASAQYVIATATGNSSSGFGTRYCAWHSSTTTTSAGDVAYTNLPYITDAGTSCGANFLNSSGVSLGPDAGITIVGGHEFAETETDQFPSTGWTDGSGYEIGDKCAWNSLTSDQSLNGTTFPVQPLWSNATSNCVLSY